MGCLKGRNIELQIPFAWLPCSNGNNDGFLTGGGPLKMAGATAQDTFRCWLQGEMKEVRTLDALVRRAWLLESKCALNSSPRFTPSAYLGWPTPAILRKTGYTRGELRGGHQLVPVVLVLAKGSFPRITVSLRLQLGCFVLM